MKDREGIMEWTNMKKKAKVEIFKKTKEITGKGKEKKRAIIKKEKEKVKSD